MFGLQSPGQFHLGLAGRTVIGRLSVGRPGRLRTLVAENAGNLYDIVQTLGNLV